MVKGEPVEEALRLRGAHEREGFGRVEAVPVVRGSSGGGGVEALAVGELQQVESQRAGGVGPGALFILSGQVGGHVALLVLLAAAAVAGIVSARFLHFANSRHMAGGKTQRHVK